MSSRRNRLTPEDLSYFQSRIEQEIDDMTRALPEIEPGDTKRRRMDDLEALFPRRGRVRSLLEAIEKSKSKARITKPRERKPRVKKGAATPPPTDETKQPEKTVDAPKPVDSSHWLEGREDLSEEQRTMHLRIESAIRMAKFDSEAEIDFVISDITGGDYTTRESLRGAEVSVGDLQLVHRGLLDRANGEQS